MNFSDLLKNQFKMVDEAREMLIIGLLIIFVAKY